MHVIIFIPGILGSRLSLGGEEVWPPTITEITLGYRRIDKLVDPAVVATAVIDRVCLRAVYEPLLADLATLAGGGTLVPFAYDWRLDIRDTATALAQRIQKAVADGATRVSLVAHSMGGLVARLAVEEPAHAGAPWLARVQDLLLLAAPQLGAPLALARALGLEGTLGLSPEDLRVIGADSRYPALYQLLPAPGQQVLWNTGRNATDPLDLYDPKVAKALGLASGNLSVAKATHRRLAAGARPAHLRLVHLGASGHATCLRVESGGRLRMVVADDAGDGTVPLWSAVPGNAQNDVTPGDHTGFFTDDRFRTTLYRLFGQHLPATPFATADETPRLRLSVDAFTYAPNAEIDVLVVPLNPARQIDGAVAVRGSTGAGPSEAPASPPQPVRYDGPRVKVLRLKLQAPAIPGQYRLVFTGSHATGPDDSPAFAVSRAV
ncbi:hypothetical protein VQ03_03755 [Methylobacterium tarhaniae]|uniref:Lecithin:cholesterol acyltransferase n=1 Tax=Methylobacterium tarhaniae TaxID=1187852 RepID=A0A0J6TFB1_9HYPH|nr:hypothetical protein [Methylobacterium tarhaniae]KMO44383.1 hypothetical protein VQ03_03755 [Methylobacterium tarhaniae]